MYVRISTSEKTFLLALGKKTTFGFEACALDSKGQERRH